MNKYLALGVLFVGLGCAGTKGSCPPADIDSTVRMSKDCRPSAFSWGHLPGVVYIEQYPDGFYLALDLNKMFNNENVLRPEAYKTVKYTGKLLEAYPDVFVRAVFGPNNIRVSKFIGMLNAIHPVKRPVEVQKMELKQEAGMDFAVIVGGNFNWQDWKDPYP